MNTVELIRQNVKTAHEWFEGTVAGVSDEMAHARPAGNAHPIGSRYAHMVVGEDTMVNAILKGGAPLYASAWAGKTGIPDPDKAFSTSLEWAQNVRIDLDELRSYAQAVYENTDRYLASVDPEELERTIDLSAMEMGSWSLGSFLLTFVLGHARDIMGEISALKGIQGEQGYPF